jgi:phosphoribosylformimino-5-aminoimidazole carboxamide ribotide isomerase
VPVIIIPSLDLLRGKVVRLKKGNPMQSVIYYDDPQKALARLEEDGAELVHVVDLNGALGLDGDQHDLIASLAGSTRVKIQVGGGIRTKEAAFRMLEAGARRIVLGTAAIVDPNFIRGLGISGERIVLGVDFKDGAVMTHGWARASALTFDDLIKTAEDNDVSAILATDVHRDGMLEGPNYETYRYLQKKTKRPIIASGGVGSEDDLAALSAMDLYAAIVGKAYYENRIDLRGIIRRVRT